MGKRLREGENTLQMCAYNQRTGRAERRVWQKVVLIMVCAVGEKQKVAKQPGAAISNEGAVYSDLNVRPLKPGAHCAILWRILSTIVVNLHQSALVGDSRELRSLVCVGTDLRQPSVKSFLSQLRPNSEYILAMEEEEEVGHRK